MVPEDSGHLLIKRKELGAWGKEGAVQQGWGCTGTGGLSLWPLGLRRLLRGRCWLSGLNGLAGRRRECLMVKRYLGKNLLNVRTRGELKPINKETLTTRKLKTQLEKNPGPRSSAPPDILGGTQEQKEEHRAWTGLATGWLVLQLRANCLLSLCLSFLTLYDAL